MSFRMLPPVAVLGGEAGIIYCLVVREKNAGEPHYACLFINDFFVSLLLIHFFQETCRNLNYLSSYYGVSLLTEIGQQLKKLLKKPTGDKWMGWYKSQNQLVTSG